MAVVGFIYLRIKDVQFSVFERIQRIFSSFKFVFEISTLASIHFRFLVSLLFSVVHTLNNLENGIVLWFPLLAAPLIDTVPLAALKL